MDNKDPMEGGREEGVEGGSKGRKRKMDRSGVTVGEIEIGINEMKRRGGKEQTSLNIYIKGQNEDN